MMSPFSTPVTVDAMRAAVAVVTDPGDHRVAPNREPSRKLLSIVCVD